MQLKHGMNLPAQLPESRLESSRVCSLASDLPIVPAVLVKDLAAHGFQ